MKSRRVSLDVEKIPASSISSWRGTAERRALLQESEALKAERNRTSKSIGASKDKEALTALREQMRAVGQRIKGLDSDVAEIEQRITATVS